MSAYLHYCGASPVCIDLLKIRADTAQTSSLSSCRNVWWSLSMFGLLLVCNLYSASYV